MLVQPALVGLLSQVGSTKHLLARLPHNSDCVSSPMGFSEERVKHLSFALGTTEQKQEDRDADRDDHHADEHVDYRVL